MFGYFKALARLTVIEQTLIAHGKRMEEIESDWADMHSRCRKLMLRAERRADEREKDVQSPVEVPTNGEGGAAMTGAFLTPRQRAVQQQILRSRAHRSLDRG